jgi:ketosteroid isomerase-like protein
VSDDLEFVDYAMGVTLQGADAFIDYARSWANAFSGRGTHDGTLPTPNGDVPPTGRTIDTPFTWFCDVADGKLARVGDYYDAMTIMAQLGLVPEPAGA